MLKINDVERLYLGIQGENNARQITIDVSAWIGIYPNGSVTIWHRRNGDEIPQPTGAVYDSDTMTVSWAPTETDTYVSGEGEAEIRLTDTNVIKKSKAVKTGVSPSVTLAGTPLGSDWQSYINAVDGIRAQAVAAQEAAEDAQEAAETAQAEAEAAQEAAEDAQAAAESAQAGAEDAQAAAETAQGKAEDAQDAAETAQDAAETAQGKAEDAQEAAETAQGAAETAQAAAEAAQTAAAGSATAAASSATAAAGSATAAAGSASTAGQKATAAAASATAASTAATAAGTSETNAEGYAIAAAGSATEADGYATAAAEAQTAAETKATAAGASATSAAASATAAASSESAAETAQGKAEDAQEAAETAQAAAEDAQEAAEAAAESVEDSVEQIETNKENIEALEKYKAIAVIDNASGSIASFSDGADGIPVKKLTVAVEPVQDLHGQSNPYPPGGGVNIWDEEWEVGTYDISTGEKKSASSAIRSKNFIPVAPDTQYYFGVGSVSVGGIAFICCYDENHEFIGIKGAVNRTVFTTASNCKYITFGLGNDYGTSYKNDISINYPATDTEYYPYSNICPISGWTGCNVTRTGVNVWDEEWEVGSYNTSTGAKTTANAIRSKNFIPVFPGTAYYIGPIDAVASGNAFICCYDKSKNFIQTIGAVLNSHLFTTPENCYYINFGVGTAYGTTYNNDISINYPATDTDYHPGHVATYSITFPDSAGTVYDATLIVNDDGTGKLVVDRAYDQMTYSYLSGLSSSYIDYQTGVTSVGGNAVWVRNWNYDKAAGRKDGGIKATCNMFPVSMHNNLIFSSQYRTYFGIGSMTSIAEFLTAVQTAENNGSGLYVAYELATPVIYNLTCDQVTTVLGLNYIFADTGDVSADYRADTKLYIAKELSATQQMLELIVTANREEAMKATKAYTTGNLLIVNGTLYRATTSIANGATLTVGTNVTATTVANELAALA